MKVSPGDLHSKMELKTYMDNFINTLSLMYVAQHVTGWQIGAEDLMGGCQDIYGKPDRAP
jgi:hypothetical protein